MPLIFRVMTRDGEFPMIGNTARTLGVRVPDDIAEFDGMVIPGTGGMSVAPDWRDLPAHRIPRRLQISGKARKARGSDEDACWVMGRGSFEAGQVAEGLELRLDRPKHGTVEPAEPTTLERFRTNLSSTQSAWRIQEE